MTAATPSDAATHKKPSDPKRAAGLALLWVDGEAIVVDKPAGLPVDPPRDGSLSMANRLRALSLNFAKPPVLIHRLDRDTSGCLLLARSVKAARRFAATWEAGLVEKRYLAVLDGVPDEREGMVDLALGKTSSAERGWRMVPDAGGKRAVSHWRVVMERGGQTLIEFRPETGRTHQLRVHAAAGLGYAIVGDPVYGSGRPGDPPLLLHAHRLLVPREGKPPVGAIAPLPERFTAAGWEVEERAHDTTVIPAKAEIQAPEGGSAHTDRTSDQADTSRLDPRFRGDDGERVGQGARASDRVGRDEELAANAPDEQTP